MKKKVKAKPKIKRKKRVMYTCIGKVEQSRMFMFEKKNIHDAWDNVDERRTTYALTFEFNIPLKRYRPEDGFPEVVAARMEYVTTNKDVADKYVVGQEYSELP